MLNVSIHYHTGLVKRSRDNWMANRNSLGVVGPLGWYSSGEFEKPLIITRVRGYASTVQCKDRDVRTAMEAFEARHNIGF